MVNEHDNYRNEAHKAFDKAFPDFFKAFPPELLRLANMAFDFAYGYGREEGREEGRADHFADVSKMINGIIIDGKVYESVSKGSRHCSDCDFYEQCDITLTEMCTKFGEGGNLFRYSQSLTRKLNEK